MADSLFAIIYPSECSLCHEELQEATLVDVCGACWSELTPYAGPACAQCGLPFPSEHAMDSSLALCPQCRADEFHFDLARSFALYGGKLRLAILQLKFRRRARLGKRLGELLSVIWDSMGVAASGGPVLVMPVPLHPTRQRERGFNQAELLARGLIGRIVAAGNAGNIRLETRCLRRVRRTLPQTGLSIPQRKENVHAVFDVVHPERLAGRTVVLVDDVMTTGATLAACAAALKKAGVLRVIGLTLARATPQFPDLNAEGHSQTIDDFRHESP